MIHTKEIVWRGKNTLATFCKAGKKLWAHIDGEIYLYEKKSFLTKQGSIFSFGPLKSPMPGKIQKVNVKEEQEIKAGESLLVLEAMKMEYMIKVPVGAKVTKVLVSEGQQVKEGQVLLEVEEV